MKGHVVLINEGELAALIRMTGPTRKVVKTNWGLGAPRIYIETSGDLWMVRALREMRPERKPRHEVMLASSRRGCWANCSCGWGSDLYTTVSGAHYAFGQHLLATLEPGVPA